MWRYVNDYVIESKNIHPDKLIGFISLNPKAKDIEKILGLNAKKLLGI